MSEVVGSVAGSWPYLPPESRGNLLSPAWDWWSLGVIVARAVTGRHMFQEPDGSRLLPDSVISNQLFERTYTVPTTGDQRWDLLIRGLLTHDRHHRWAGDQVAQWLAGGSPTVYQETTTSAANDLKPFAFANGEYRDPADLAKAFRAHWKEAGELLVGRGAEDLRVWLRRTSVASAADSVLDGRISNPESPLVRLQLIMDPASAPRFRDRELSTSGLASAISDATAGNKDAVSWITALRKERILFAWGSEADVPSEIRHADDVLKAWWDQAEAALLNVRGADSNTVRGALESILLSAALNPSERERIRSAGHEAAAKANPVPAWASSIKSNALANGASAAQSAVASLVLPAASKNEKARLGAEQAADRERKRQAAEAEERRRRVDELNNKIRSASKAAHRSWWFLWILVVPVGFPGGPFLYTWLTEPQSEHEKEPAGAIAGTFAVGIALIVLVLILAVRRTQSRARLRALSAELARLR